MPAVDRDADTHCIHSGAGAVSEPELRRVQAAF